MAMSRVSISSLFTTDMLNYPGTMSLEYAWSQVEPATAIICASLVTYRPLFVNIRKNLTTLTGKLVQDKKSRATETDWTDMSNSKTTPVRWAVADDFVDRDVIDYRQIGRPNAHHALDHSSLIANSQEMKPLPRCPMSARIPNHLTIHPGHTVLRLSQDGTFKLDSPV